MAEQRRLALGIDLGGTAIKVGVVTHKGEIIGRGERPTEVELGAAGVIKNMARAAQDAMDAAHVTAAELEGAGVGAPVFATRSMVWLFMPSTLAPGTMLRWQRRLKRNSASPSFLTMTPTVRPSVSSGAALLWAATMRS